MAKSSGKFLTNPFNETNSGDEPDISGGGIYGSYEEVISAQGSTEGGDLDETSNSKSGRGILGGPAPGEPNPSDLHASVSKGRS